MTQILKSAYYRFCRLFFSAYCSLKVEGKERLPKPPYILCSNHCSHLDTPALMLSTGLPFATFGMVAAKDYFFANKSKKWLSLLMNLLPVDRSPNRSAIEDHINLCRDFLNLQKGVIILYPEGTRSITGKMRSLRKGAVQYAHKLQVPIVPAYIEGTFDSFPKGKNFPRPKTIKVTFGEPFYVNESGLAALRQATDELESRILNLTEIHG